MISPRRTDGGDLASPASSTTWIFSAIVLVNAARMVPNNSEKWWAGIEGGLNLEGKSALTAMLVCTSIVGRGRRHMTTQYLPNLVLSC